MLRGFFYFCGLGSRGRKSARAAARLKQRADMFMEGRFEHAVSAGEVTFVLA
jgi:hypothetical protein